MSSLKSRSPGLKQALTVLSKSHSFRLASRKSLTLLFGCVSVLLCGIFVGLFAIDSQTDLLLSLKEVNVLNSGDGWHRVFLVFLALQLIFEFLNWFKRSLQNRISVCISHELRMAIYQKLSALRFAELQAVSAGELAQMYTADATQISAVWTEGILSFATTVFLTLGVSIFLTLQVGISGVVFFLVLFVLIVLARRFARQTAPLLRKRAEYSAARLALIQESIRSVMLVKALTAEQEFQNRIQEQAGLEQEMKLRATEVSCRFIPVFASLRWLGWAGLLCWVIYMPLLQGQPLSGEVLVGLVFSVNWYSSLLQDSFLFVGNYLSAVQVGAVSAQRLDRFLQLNVSGPRYVLSSGTESVLSLVNVSVAYPGRSEYWALNDVSIEIPRGKLTVVTGAVGSGKSTLLRTLLGELEIGSGELRCSPGVRAAYLAQDVTLPSATLRDALRFQYENSSHEDSILLGLLSGAEFASDLRSLPGGLGTLVGERGVILSGGQRVRVGLAQISYFKEAEVILLDDPLSALDSVTAEAVIRHLFLGVWHGKTLIITGHQPQLLDGADCLVELDSGRVARVTSRHF